MNEAKKLADKTYSKPSFDDRMDEGGLFFWTIAICTGAIIALLVAFGLGLDLLLN